MRQRNAREIGRVAGAWAIRLLLAVAALLSAWFVAGAIGGIIPVNRSWRQADSGVTVWIESNGIHTGIVMPKVAAGVDWRPLFPARDLGDPRYGGHDHVAVGWGEHAFYLDTPTWADVSPRTVLAAAIGSERILVHVDHLARPRIGDHNRAVVLRPGEYRRLAAFVRATLVPGGRRYRGYGRWDVFYEARGRYDAVHTCNQWTRDALAHAGVRVGAWTPLPEQVLQWF